MMTDIEFNENDIVAQEVRDHVVITIPKEYLKRSVEAGITTGNAATVTDKDEMSDYYVHHFMSLNDGGYFNKCIDYIADDAIENGEQWLKED